MTSALRLIQLRPSHRRRWQLRATGRTAAGSVGARRLGREQGPPTVHDTAGGPVRPMVVLREPRALLPGGAARPPTPGRGAADRGTPAVASPKAAGAPGAGASRVRPASGRSCGGCTARRPPPRCPKCACPAPRARHHVVDGLGGRVAVHAAPVVAGEHAAARRAGADLPRDRHVAVEADHGRNGDVHRFRAQKTVTRGDGFRFASEQQHRRPFHRYHAQWLIALVQDEGGAQRGDIVREEIREHPWGRVIAVERAPMSRTYHGDVPPSHRSRQV